MTEIFQKWAACIVYYQDLASLQALISNLNSQTLKPTEIFIADNNSNIEANIKNSAIKTEVIKLQTNLGFGPAANVAIKLAIKNGFEKLILLSQDVLLEEQSCEKIIKKLNVTNGIVFPTMMNKKNDKIYSKGGTINIFTGKIKLETKKVPKIIYWADGSCLSFEKNTYLKIKGFSEKYFMYFEDVDFCLKAKKNHFSLNHVDTIVYQNPNGPTSFLRSRNSLLLARSYNNKLFLFSVLKRNILGALLLLVKFNFIEGLLRLKGIRAGWKVDIER